jgi:uncharacterized protein YegJ (DUF2314 family)
MRLLAATIAAAIVLSAAPGSAQEQLRPGAAGDDQVMGFSPLDQAMNGAVAEARRTLPLFWAALESGDGDRYSLKAEFPSRDASEHMWVRDIRRTASGYSGVLQNQPLDIPGMNLGDRVTFTERQISDWSYVKGGLLWGAYTTRVMVDHMTPEEQSDWRRILSPTPVEGQVI